MINHRRDGDQSNPKPDRHPSHRLSLAAVAINSFSKLVGLI
jgi:hypothetical protein